MKKQTPLLLLLVVVLCFTEFVPIEAAAEKDPQLYLQIMSDGNLIFSTYDIEIALDGNWIGVVENGKYYTGLFTVSTGLHELTFHKASSKTISASYKIRVTNDMTFSCELSHTRTAIEVEHPASITSITGHELEVADVSGMVLSEAVQNLSRIGFINIREEPFSEIWDDTHWTVVSQNIKAGTITDKNTRIILNCQKTSELEKTVVAAICSPDASSTSKVTATPRPTAVPSPKPTTTPRPTVTPKPTVVPTVKPTPTRKPAPSPAAPPVSEREEAITIMVWIPTNGGTKYHSSSGCSKMKNPSYVTIDEAIRMGFTACKKCW